MTAFNADTMVAALTPPSVTIQGHTYTGRLLSFLQVEPLRANFRNATKTEDVTAAVRAICEAVDIPAEIVMALPPWVMGETIQSFFECLYGAPPAAQGPPTLPPGSSGS